MSKQPPKPKPNEIKHRLREQGHTLKSFAELHGFKYKAVSEVVRGIRRGNFGDGRRIRLALGLPVSE
jgi:gp16 family phage-associated protein